MAVAVSSGVSKIDWSLVLLSSSTVSHGSAKKLVGSISMDVERKYLVFGQKNDINDVTGRGCLFVRGVPTLVILIPTVDLADIEATFLSNLRTKNSR